MTARSEACHKLEPRDITLPEDVTRGGQREERHTLMLVSPIEESADREGLSQDGEMGDRQKVWRMKVARKTKTKKRRGRVKGGKRRRKIRRRKGFGGKKVAEGSDEGGKGRA